MEFRDLEYFAALAEHGHIGRAAEALDLSQPALSLSLRRLEEAMQTKLMKRTPKGVELTATGTALLARVQRLRLVREDVLREVADLRQGRAGILRIGSHPGTITFPVAPACAELLKDAADLELVVTTAMNSGLVPALRSGELDLIVHDAFAPQEDLVQEHLFDDPLVIFVAANHRLAKRKQVTIQDLAQERWTSGGNTQNRDTLAEVSLRVGNPALRVGITTTSAPLNLHLVATAGLVGTTTRSNFNAVGSQCRVAEIKVNGLERVRRVHVSYRKDGYLSPAGRRMIDILKATVKKGAANPKP